MFHQGLSDLGYAQAVAKERLVSELLYQLLGVQVRGCRGRRQGWRPDQPGRQHWIAASARRRATTASMSSWRTP